MKGFMFGFSSCLGAIVACFLLFCGLFLMFILGVTRVEQGPKPVASTDNLSVKPPPPNALPPATDPSLEFQKPEPPPAKPILKYSVAQKWLPNDEPNGLGLEIVLENPEPTKEELIDLVTQITAGRDPVSLKVYATQAAYDTQKTYGDEWDRGYLLAYVKNGTGKGAFQGFNEIRWMASAGKFADDPETREGAVTKLPASK
ncbi:MAG: hypothetical protein ACK56G_19200 [Pirellulaceae bacterium]|jgi:hypothetical protein